MSLPAIVPEPLSMAPDAMLTPPWIVPETLSVAFDAMLTLPVPVPEPEPFVTRSVPELMVVVP